MATNLEFYFDFSSPYGYFAAEQIDQLAAKYQREVNWHPLLLSVIFKSTGALPLTQIPLKREYTANDLMRISRLTGIAYKTPSVFPISGVNPSRAVIYLSRSQPSQAKALALALYRAFFTESQNIGEVEVVCQIAQNLGLNAEELKEGMNDPNVKEQLRHEVGAAEARGVFGSPFVIADGEPFWGFDRFYMLEEWLKRGGF